MGRVHGYWSCACAWVKGNPARSTITGNTIFGPWCDPYFEYPRTIRKFEGRKMQGEFVEGEESG
jgi:hypothetical protein